MGLNWDQKCTCNPTRDQGDQAEDRVGLVSVQVETELLLSAFSWDGKVAFNPQIMKNRFGFLNIKISISALVRPMSRKDVLLAGSVERINIPDPVDKLR